MANGSGVTLEGVHAEVERLGGDLRNLIMQLAGMRSRVSDLEHWDVPLLAMAKKKKRKAKGAKRPKRPKGKGGTYKGR